MAWKRGLERAVAIALAKADLASIRRIARQRIGAGRLRCAFFAANGAGLAPPETGLAVTLAVSLIAPTVLKGLLAAAMPCAVTSFGIT